MGVFLSFGEGMVTYQARTNHVHDSTSEKQERTTQYMSHGVNWAGSEVRRALYEANIGKSMVIMDLKIVSAMLGAVMQALGMKQTDKGGEEGYCVVLGAVLTRADLG